MGKLSPPFSLFPQPGNGKISSCILYSDTNVKLKWPFSIFHWGHIVSSCQVHAVKDPLTKPTGRSLVIILRSIWPSNGLRNCAAMAPPQQIEVPDSSSMQWFLLNTFGPRSSSLIQSLFSLYAFSVKTNGWTKVQCHVSCEMVTL